MNYVQQMVVGSDWSSTFLFKSGTPSIPVPIVDWTIEGKAWKSHYEWTSLFLTTEEILNDEDEIIPPRLKIQPYIVQAKDIKNDRSLVIGQEVQILIVTLEEDDTFFLGEGTIEFEIRRVDPQPTRPILKFQMVNKKSYVRSDDPQPSQHATKGKL